MTALFDSVRFMETAESLQKTLDLESDLLDQKKYDALQEIWHKKEACLYDYEHQSFLWRRFQKNRTTENIVDLNTFRVINQTILDLAQKNEIKLRELRDFSTFVMHVMVESTRPPVPNPQYSAQGILQCPNHFRDIIPLKTNQYF